MRRRAGRDWLWPIAAWLLLRMISSAAAWYSVSSVRQGERVFPPGYAPADPVGLHRFLAAPWLRSDALWYLKIAEQGYGEAGTYAFFPLFPIAVRYLQPFFGGSELIAGLVLASAAALAGLTLLYKTFKRWMDPSSAGRAVMAFALFPTSFFLVAPYAEPMLLAAGSGALLAATKGKSLAAAAAGALAGVSRPFGVLLVVPLALLQRGKLSRRATAAAGPLVGFGIWAAYVAFRTGDWLAAVRVQSIWQRRPAFFPLTIKEGWDAWQVYRGQEIATYLLIDLLAVVFAVALTIAAVVVLRRGAAGTAVGVYGAAALISTLSSAFPLRPLLSMPRFVLALFPSFAALGRLPSWLWWTLISASAAGLFAATVVFVASRPLY